MMKHERLPSPHSRTPERRSDPFPASNVSMLRSSDSCCEVKTATDTGFRSEATVCEVAHLLYTGLLPQAAGSAK